ncbi:tetratricopeptide repeat protein [Sphingobacterium thalpophilum]|uniref:Putative PEP-CTERM system TPR-repeat lipoprotein n=1 Tax=Sphingobacterium thalpophilum TaxID=259 RepID=A0A4U9VYP0_9SPHI|nr:hypothetical protein [Sphingobacterium thalpophilum]VTR48941.1 putative PEP-CTERM system TPR-repeat lipoprotein [Sphingobacterium thalpophilum]
MMKKLVLLFLCLSTSLLLGIPMVQGQRKNANKPDVKTIKNEIEKILKQGGAPDQAKLEKLAKQYAIQQTVSEPKKESLYKTKINRTQVSRASLTGKKLTDYIEKLLGRLEPKMDPETVQIVNKIEQRSDTNSNIMSQLSYYLYLIESEDAALLLGGRTILKDPLNDLATNNFAAMLTSCGAAPQAIPILRGLIPQNQKNAMVLNNLGQAFASVGMRDSAMFYFNKCLMLEPKHAMANKTAAKLSADAGNKTQAIEQAKKSLEGEITLEALELIDELDSSPDKFEFLAHEKNIPDYFNLYKFKKPSLQRKHTDAEVVRAEQNAFLTEIDRMIEQLNILIDEETKISLIKSQERVQRTQAEAIEYGRISDKLFSPMNEMAAKIYASKYINRDIFDELQKIEKTYTSEIEYRRQSYANDLNSIMVQYAEKKKAYNCDAMDGSGCKMLEKLTLEECEAKNKRLDVFLDACATAAERYEQRQLQLARERFFFHSKWGYMMGHDPHRANANHYHAAKDYLLSIRKVVGYAPEQPFCRQLKELLKTYRFEDIIKPYCPINNQFDIGAMSLKINCTESTLTIKLDHFIEAAELGKLSKKAAFWLDGMKLQFKSDHVKRNTTISVIKTWLEQSVEVPKMLTPIRWKAGAKVEVSTTAYITIDGRGQIADGGLKGTAMTTAWSGVDSDVTGAMNQIEAGVEMGLGFNSGAFVSPKGMLAELFTGLGT